MKKISLPVLGFVFLILAACGTEDSGVASLIDQPTIEAEAVAEVNGELTDEDRALSFAECLRDEGLEAADPTVDSDGNVQLPSIAIDANIDRDQLRSIMENCGEILEGLTFRNDSPDLTELTDQMVEVASCLREAGLTVDDPTTETLRQWQFELREHIDLDDPRVAELLDECGGVFGPGGQQNRGRQGGDFSAPAFPRPGGGGGVGGGFDGRLTQ